MTGIAERWTVVRQVQPEQRPMRTITRQVSPSQAPRSAGWMQRIFARAEPTTFQKCLAVHMASAAPRSAMH